MLKSSIDETGGKGHSHLGLVRVPVGALLTKYSLSIPNKI